MECYLPFSSKLLSVTDQCPVLLFGSISCCLTCFTSGFTGTVICSGSILYSTVTVPLQAIAVVVRVVREERCVEMRDPR